MTIDELVTQIKRLDDVAMAAARARQDQLTKPQGALGRLEKLSIRLAGIQRRALPQVTNKVVVIMAGDHGVAEEGVSAYPQEVTAQMVLNFLQGGAAINVLARQAGARVVVVDMGVASELPTHPELIVKKMGLGTANIAKGPAMSRADAVAAILAGAAVAQAEIEKGLDILAMGDMGIANTTPSAAIACVILDKSPHDIVGRGTGIDGEGMVRKLKAVRNALDINQPDPDDGLDILTKVGGFEIGGLAGAALAAAAAGRPIIIDGYISTAAAMIAVKIAPEIRPYLFAAHRSQEQGHQRMLDWLGLNPLLNLHMRLGEGSGAAMTFPIFEAACRILSEMATFGEAGVAGKE